jgi:hypothetical protein
MVVCFGIQLSSGIEYKGWFDNADNAYRTAVIPLAVCSVLLAAFLAWARWDIVWRDPGRLVMSTLMRTILILFAVAVVLRLVGIEWGDVPGDLLLAITISWNRTLSARPCVASGHRRPPDLQLQVRRLSSRGLPMGSFEVGREWRFGDVGARVTWLEE